MTLCSIAILLDEESMQVFWGLVACIGPPMIFVEMVLQNFYAEDGFCQMRCSLRGGYVSGVAENIRAEA